MKRTVSTNQSSKNNIKMVALSVGGVYAVFGLFSMVMMKLQSTMISNFKPLPDESFMNLLNTLHEIWRVYMPLLSLLGIGYLVFGFLYEKITANKYQINLILSLLCLTWGIAYSISCTKFLDAFFHFFPDGMTNGFEGLTYIKYGFSGFGFISIFALMTAHQYIISKRIKKQEIENEQ